MIADSQGDDNLGTKVMVEVNNSLPGDASFNIHCKSKDDDLGIHIIGVYQNYKFKFKVNFWATTLFFCGIRWQGGGVTFDIYYAKRDLNRCPHHCLWLVREVGVMGFQQDKPTPDIIIPWDN
ncbi:S-protein homolog 5-like [Punica granatum]|nr:S-protein homolog 5-like [Punica granatum]OWM73851.1 hypothetical protein CDL15_Pgr018911 [Punica granatum]